MIKNYLISWDKFVSLRNSKLENINYTNESEMFVLVLFARINALCNEILYLVKNNMTASSEIILRSVLESYIDLKCLVDDPSYIDVIYQSEREQDIKYYKNRSSNNPYNRNISKEEVEKKLKKLSSKNDKKSHMSFFDKFKKADELNAYHTVYNNLCRHSHGNITALASKTFDNGRVVIDKLSSKTELNLICSSTINSAIASTIEVMAFFKYEKQDIDSMKKLLERNNE